MRTLALSAVLVLPILLAAGCQTNCPLFKCGKSSRASTEEHRSVAARAEAVLKEAEGTPGQEQANFFRTPPRAEWLRKLKGEEKASKAELDSAAQDIRRIISVAEQGPTWPRPPAAKVPFAPQAIKVDGGLDDPAWAKALTYTETYPFNKKDKVETPKTTWKLLWDKTYLYFGFDCADTDIVSPQIPRDDHVYNNDCVEMFILPDFRFRTYWELVIGPSGSIFDSIQCKHPEQWGFSSRVQETLEGLQVGIDIRGTLNKSDDHDQGYTVEVAVPFAQLPGYSRAQPQAGHTLHFMLVRLDRQGKEFGVYAYQPLLSWGHNIWNHAQMVLGE